MKGKVAKRIRKHVGFKPGAERSYTVMDGTIRPLMRITAALDEKGNPVFEQYGSSYTLMNDKKSSRAAYQALKKLHKVLNW